MKERQGSQVSIGLMFWVLMVIWFALWLVGRYSPAPWGPFVNDLFLFFLFFLLGWKAFGFVIHI